MDRYSTKDFGLSTVSFHEQTLGAHNFINRAQRNQDTIRGYALLLQIDLKLVSRTQPNIHHSSDDCERQSDILGTLTTIAWFLLKVLPLC
jgi:hypothetical protein